MMRPRNVIRSSQSVISGKTAPLRKEVTESLFPGFEVEEVQVSSARIHTLRKGDGPPLLLLHGYPQTHVIWRKIAGRLAEKFSVVLTDLRGYNLTEETIRAGHRLAQEKPGEVNAALVKWLATSVPGVWPRPS
jgi:alpha/beta hydrolase fold